MAERQLTTTQEQQIIRAINHILARRHSPKRAWAVIISKPTGVAPVRIQEVREPERVDKAS